MTKLFVTLAIVLIAIAHEICARSVETTVYTVTSSGHHETHSYKVGDDVEIGCYHSMVWSPTFPEKNDKVESVNFLKDGVLFFKSEGIQKDYTYPTKGINDAEGRGWGVMSHEVAINSASGGGNDQTAGSYTCQVVYHDYQGNPGNITSAASELKLK